MTLTRIIVPEQARGNGVGTRAMAELCAQADRHGWTLDLTANADYRAHIGRLSEFYTRFGCVPN